MQDALELRRMTEGDLPAVLALAHEQGRNVHREEYARFLALEGAMGLVLARDERIIAALTAIRYFAHGFLGPVIAPAGADGHAIALLAHAVEQLQRNGATLIEAEASGDEAAILSRMGFRAVRQTAVLERAPAAAVAGTPRTAPLVPADFLDLGALDAAAVGYGRKEFLYALLQDHPDGARVVRGEHDVHGYSFLRRSRRGYHLGPLVTREGDIDSARDLLADAIALGAGWPLVALAPAEGALLPELEAASFERVATLVRMRAGPDPHERAGGATEWLVGSRITG